ncbi:hypothetical protein KC359_g207 [Hortaea werneckii]|nr:hypothetical protein KC359_g207 [Hortaea werneckii]
MRLSESAPRPEDWRAHFAPSLRFSSSVTSAGCGGVSYCAKVSQTLMWHARARIRIDGQREAKWASVIPGKAQEIVNNLSVASTCQVPKSGQTNKVSHDLACVWRRPARLRSTPQVDLQRRVDRVATVQAFAMMLQAFGDRLKIRVPLPTSEFKSMKKPYDGRKASCYWQLQTAFEPLSSLGSGPNTLTPHLMPKRAHVCGLRIEMLADPPRIPRNPTARQTSS